ncbi:LptA/OstA family protein [Candidatus Trichorickettsia mobilis]|uniref:LptA/OstA family protein n=1 Tax=Candidatus Trichorickettsia mobilis TaxID=1346319 RepID=UPI002B25BCF8|nr:LptA/OstA family protein [Candidatus Trichorickettsia mobilis]
MNLFYKISLIIISCYSLTTYGNNNNLHIHSDNVTFDKNSRTVDFSGTVIIWFDDIILKTSVLKILYKNSAKGKQAIDRIIIPNKLSALKISNQNIIIADAAVYNHQQEELTLTGNIKFIYQDHILQTEKLLYHTKLNKIDHHNNKHQRANIDSNGK